jgi:adenine-specific DNA-methyltransferase
MPTIQFKGKRAVWSYHLSVPFHTLDEDTSLSFRPEKAEGSGGRRNLIIEGDNLLALKALSPQYTGKIKCICIDPPYNTGNENWVYNDNVNNPLFKTWLGKTVGKDDLTRHDKWLCMMTPRLQLMRDLLSDDGAIFIDIEDNEYTNLKQLMDELWGDDNFVGTFIWRKKEGGGQTKEYFVKEHEYILVYRKTEKFEWIDDTLPEDDISYHFEDSNGKYKLVKLAKWGTASKKEDRPKMHFSITAPDDTKIIPYAPDGSLGRWRVGKAKMELLLESNLVEFKKDENDKWIAYEKLYYDENNIKTIKERTILYELTNTADASKQLTELFGKKDMFDTPKPVELVKYFLSHATNKDDIILDAFAGSGTTLHAIMDLNNEDGGNRSCILIQATEPSDTQKNICENITRERNKRAIEKYNYNSGFAYLKVGIALDAETMLSGQLPEYRQFAEYVYYLCTGKHLADKSDVSEETYFVAEYENAVIYLIYKKDFEALSKMALNITIAKDIIARRPNKRYIVYAPSCWLEDDFMKDNKIDFVGIPYNLFERVETR